MSVQPGPAQPTGAAKLSPWQKFVRWWLALRCPPQPNFSYSYNADEALQRLGVAAQLHSTYVGNLNNLLGFFLIIAGLLAAGYFQLLSGDSPRFLMACVVGGVGGLVTVQFLFIDFRSRTIVEHIEAVIAGLEANAFPQNVRPHGGIPPAKSIYNGSNDCLRFHTNRGLTNLVRSIYLLFLAGFLSLALFAFSAWFSPAPQTAEPASLSIDVSSSVTVKQSPADPAAK